MLQATAHHHHQDQDQHHQDQDHHHKVNNHHVKESIKNKNIIEEKDIAKILKEIKDNEKTTSINIIKKKINKNIQKIKKNMSYRYLQNKRNN